MNSWEFLLYRFPQSKNEGISDLIDQLIETAEQKKVPEHLDFCTGEVHKAIHSIAHIIEDQAAGLSLSGPFRRHEAGGGR